jgi:hypothetical protein
MLVINKSSATKKSVTIRRDIVHLMPCLPTGPTVPVVSHGKNPNMPAASSLVTITSSPEQGRYAVATERIATGDTVVVEPPYAACLLPDMFGTHCHHCFIR